MTAGAQPETFSDPTLKSNPRIRIQTVSSTLGHQTSHALNAEQTVRTCTTSLAALPARSALLKTAPHQWSAYLMAPGRTRPLQESTAGIHGWNPRLEYAGEPDRAPQGTSPSEQEMLARVGELRGGTDESPSLEDGIILDTDKEMSDTGLPEAGTISLGNAQPKREAPAFAGASEYGREGLPSCIGRA